MNILQQAIEEYRRDIAEGVSEEQALESLFGKGYALGVQEGAE